MTDRLLAAATLVPLVLAACGSTTAPTPAPPPPAAASTTTPPTPPRPSEAQIRQWLVEHGMDAGSGYAHITRITWSGETLVFTTDMFADSDARVPAIGICGTGMLYLADRGHAPHVQVMDSAGQILASQRGATDRCTWRR